MTNPPPGWYPDQQSPQHVRWWDGQTWTAHVQPAQQQPAPQQQGQQYPGQQYQAQQYPGQPRRHDAEAIELDIERAHDPSRIREQVAKGTGNTGGQQAGGGTLYSEPILVVNQRAKLIEMAGEFGVFDQHGQRIGSVVQVGQSTLKKVMRLVSNYDQFMTHRFEVRDAGENTLLQITRPAKVFKSRFLVARGDGAQVGEIVQENVFGKIRFGFSVNGQSVGGIKAENWRAWNFVVHDHAGTEVARITKTFGGFLKAAFTTADNYVVQIHRQLPDPLASMVLASALTIDTALKQDQN